MDTFDLFQRLGLALAIGLLIGLERGWQERDVAEGGRVAGLRTFALIGLFGGICGALEPRLGGIAVGLVFASLAAILAAFRWLEATQDRDYGTTTIIAALLTLLLGLYAVMGDMTAAAAGAVISAILLASKRALHEVLKRITWEELRASLILLAMSFIALPLLPDRTVDPIGALNPHEIWILTILIAAVSFIGYVAIKLIGEEKGVLAGGAIGGFVSSTATTLNYANLARSFPQQRLTLSAGAILANLVMAVRAVVLVLIAGPQPAKLIALPLAGFMLGSGLVAAAYVHKTVGKGETGAQPLELKNPFEITMALKFGALLALIFMVAKWLQGIAGAKGIFVLSAIAGLADIDAMVVTSAHSASGSLGLGDAAIAILIAIASNTVSKVVLGAIAGGMRMGLQLALGGLAGLAGMAAGLYVAPSFGLALW